MEEQYPIPIILPAEKCQSRHFKTTLKQQRWQNRWMFISEFYDNAENLLAIIKTRDCKTKIFFTSKYH